MPTTQLPINDPLIDEVSDIVTAYMRRTSLTSALLDKRVGTGLTPDDAALDRCFTAEIVAEVAQKIAFQEHLHHLTCHCLTDQRIAMLAAGDGVHAAEIEHLHPGGMTNNGCKTCVAKLREAVNTRSRKRAEDFAVIERSHHALCLWDKFPPAIDE